MEHYFIIQNKKQKGPFSLNQIIEMNLSQNTLIWKKELKDWIQLKELSEYKSNVPPPMPKTEQFKIKEDIKYIMDNEINLTTEGKIHDALHNAELKRSDHENAGFWLRLAAFLIDFTLMSVITSFIWLLLQLPIPPNTKSFFSGNFFVFQNPLLTILFAWLFYAGFESSMFQATPGKAIIGLKVTDYDFSKITFGKASGRFFGKILSYIIIGIGYLMIGFTKNKQGLHDLMANTYVLKGNINEAKKKSTLWIIFSITIVLFIVSLFIPANTELIDLSDSFQTKNNYSETFQDIPEKVSFSYAGISFDYPNNWKVEKEELQKDVAYQINCEKKGFNSAEIFSIITWPNIELDPHEMIQNSIDGLKEQAVYKNAIFENIRNSKFNGFNCLITDFKVTLMDENYFGRITSFNIGENTVLMMKQSDSKVKLDSEFTLMEESFKIKEQKNSVRPNIKSNNSLPINLHDKRNNVKEVLGTPDRSGTDFETYYSHGLVIYYNNNQQVISICATKLVSGITYDGTVYGVSIGDKLNKCIEEWGEPFSVKETTFGYDIYVWKLTGFYIKCEIWNKTDYDSNFGNVTENTVKDIEIKI